MNEYKFENILDYSESKEEGFVECHIHECSNCGSTTTMFVKPKESLNGILYKIIKKIIVVDDEGNEKEIDCLKAYYVKRVEYTLRVFSDHETYEDVETYHTKGNGEFLS